MTAPEFKFFLKGVKFDMTNEKRLQQQIEVKLKEAGIIYNREMVLDINNVPDFFFENTGLCVEVKIKGVKSAIYRQLVRYSTFKKVNEIILVTNKSMALPAFIEGKPANLFHLGKAWM